MTLVIRRWVASPVLVAVAIVAGCTDGDTHAGSATETPTTFRDASPLRDRPLPPPVSVAAESAVELADPSFQPLAGARAASGRLGGAVYRIEMPNEWNGTLVMWMHGFNDFRPEARVDAPDFRRYLIDHHIAWAASSFSSTSMIPSLAADETAALWDHVVAEFGRPRWTYVSGFSMGGWATHIAAERYGDRYDGALALCGAVGEETGLRVSTDQLTVAAYLAGLTQADVDATTDVRALLDTRVRPILDEPATRARFVEMVVAMTGGPRAWAAEGVELELETNWERAVLGVSARVSPRRTRPYDLVGLDPDVAADLNAKAVRFPVDEAPAAEFARGMDQRGDLAMPLLSLHTTGDGQVPVDQALVLQDLVEGAGSEGRLVQRIFRDPGHCGFTTAEQEEAFAALQSWVERGREPAGTDLSDRDLDHLAPTFELQPRTTAAGDTVRLSGTATLDGRVFDAEFVGAVVLDDGLITPCQAEIPTIRRGAVDLPVLTGDAAAGCARIGSRISLWTYVGDVEVYSTPIDVRGLDELDRLTIEFHSADPRAGIAETTGINGEVYESSGERVPSGTVEARIDGNLCGHSSIRSNGSYNGFILGILRTGPDGPCPLGATVSFTVDGRPADQTIANADSDTHTVDLTVVG